MLLAAPASSSRTVHEQAVKHGASRTRNGGNYITIDLRSVELAGALKHGSSIDSYA